MAELPSGDQRQSLSESLEAKFQETGEKCACGPRKYAKYSGIFAQFFYLLLPVY